jgi:nucleoside-diphosphate-sugar epimerase
MLLAAESSAAPGRVYHITDGSQTTIGELVDRMAELAGVPRPEKQLPYGLLRVACGLFGVLGGVGLLKDPPITKVGLRFLGTSRHIDISRARRELGYVPQVAMRDGMTEYVQCLLAPSNGSTIHVHAH